MNDRIKELYRQAHTVRSWDGDPMREGNPPTVYWQDEVSANKFAELIVQECCQFENSYGGDAGLVARSFSRKIKEHFGVEE